MKINFAKTVLIGSMALTSCQRQVTNVIYQPINTVAKSIDTFTPSKINPQKTFNFWGNIAEILATGFDGISTKVGSTSSRNIKVSTTKRKSISKKKSVTNQKHTYRHVSASQVEPVKRTFSPTIGEGDYWIKGKNISYAHPTEYTVPKGGTQKPQHVASANGVSLYRLKIANPDVNLDHPLVSGTVLKIPGKYIVAPGSVQSFEDVVKTTKIDKHYIKDILVGIEGRKKKPDLVCKSDRVKSREYPNGCPTIGFGHTGRVDGKVIVNGNTKITTAKAYEILAQDILDAKLDAIEYMGKHLFDRAPASVQTGIIDIVFNKGVAAFSRKGSPTSLIKQDLEKSDYAAAAAHTVLKTGNRGLKKRNVYRTVMSTADLSQHDRNRTLQLANTHFVDALRHFSGKKGRGDRALMQQAWNNAKKGVTCDFFD